MKQGNNRTDRGSQREQRNVLTSKVVPLRVIKEQHAGSRSTIRERSRCFTVNALCLILARNGTSSEEHHARRIIPYLHLHSKAFTGVHMRIIPALTNGAWSNSGAHTKFEDSPGCPGVFRVDNEKF